MFQDFKPVLLILLKFTAIYLVLFFGYQAYLTQTEIHGLDPFSQSVAKQVGFLQNNLGYPTELTHDAKNLTTGFRVKGIYVSRMVEGCNAISVMIWFVAFVVAFYRGIKTLWFILGGLLILHIMNVLRIMGLNMVLADMPQYGKIAHDYLFPAVIYGTVVALWLIWIKFFALKK
ncbi:exosortase family protein XrtF [Chryseobacterium sp. MFBS3-17]|uniref:exosortase family protein XrtF n=1 Tax=Chryseobacterium sp. MFBS3-17 TaxID=2886689 RepID=UPI001D0E8A86|nr:exosortase family protein XrtF [Chryseobacterium sp. MFBS3-17]MCC2590584.1 exosortase family protein XrtF [Chryseobacterium sp. MFBS3-17]